MAGGRARASTQSTAGYLLAELAVAAFVFSVCFAAAVSLIHSSRALSRAAREALVAQEVAQTVLEHLRSRLPDLPPDCPDKAVALPRGLSHDLGDLTCKVSVRDYEADTPGLKKVTVCVSWGGAPGFRNAGRARKRVEVSTLMFGGRAAAQRTGSQSR